MLIHKNKGFRAFRLGAACSVALMTLTAAPAMADISLGVERFQDFESLSWPVGWGAHTLDGWAMDEGAVGKPVVHGTWENRVAMLRNDFGHFMRTPLLQNGIGTLYFQLRNFAGSEPISFRVEVSTDGAAWDLIGTGVNTSWGLGGGPAWTWHQYEINRYDDVYIRIVRTNKVYVEPPSPDDRYLAFDNITVSPPPADVTITERLYEPGYPSQNNDVLVRAFVHDKSTLNLATNRNVTLHYRWQQGALQSTNMVEIGEDFYEGFIPAHAPGTIEYFFRTDFDGYFYDHPTIFLNEEKSPRFLPESDTFARPPLPGVDDWLRYQVRMFDSTHSVVWVNANPPGASSPMLLVGENTWLAVVEVSAYTNIVLRFEGFDAYTNNAAHYQPFSYFWGDDFQDFPYPPLSGNAQLDPGATIELEFEYDGFLMFQVNTDPESGYEYTIKRAVFQDFDDWQASLDKFEYSLGLYAVQNFPANLNAWTPDTVSLVQRSEEDYEAETSTDAQFEWLVESQKFWAGSNARRIQERFHSPLPNRALMLNYEPNSRGRVWNTGQAMPEGLNTFSFRYRSALRDDHFTWYRHGFTWGNVRAEAQMRASSISPDTASISILARVVDPLNYYEFRVTQAYDTILNRDNRLMGQIWRCKDGVMTQIGGNAIWGAGLLAQEAFHKVSLRVETTGSNISLIGAVADVNRVTTTDSLAAGITATGTIGFHARDAVLLVDTVNVYTSAGAPVWNTTFAGVTIGDDWFTAGLRTDNGQPRWAIIANKLTRPLPTQTFYIQTAPAGPAPSPFWPSPSAWETHSQRTVNSLAYQTQTVTMKHWYRSFASLWQAAGDTPIVVDELAIEPWRGRTRTVNEWTVSEAWVQSLGASNNELHLDRTRANPDLFQGFTSTLLTNGIGTIAFDYSVQNAQSIFAIERTVPGDLNAWVALDVSTNAPGSSGEYYLAVRTNMIGRIRVRHLPESAATALLRVNNIVVTDYPKEGDTTWVAYNVMVTGQPPLAPDIDPNRLFLPTDPSARTAFLNNDPEANTSGAFIGNDDLPYIQSPAIGTGIGEIGFWYRVWDPKDPTPAILYLRKAPDETTPAANWVTITNLTLEADQSFQYFRMETFDTVNKVFRLYAETNNTQRVAIDNLLITEPVRAGFDVVDVTLDPPQPLVGDAVGVEARLANFLMNPQNITLRVDYHVGTNVWGRANWTSTNSIPMFQDAEDSRLFRTAAQKLPPRNIDDVVQYVVVAEYTGPFASPIEQSFFENPDWYFPVDLNSTLPGWAPYYYVFSCPPGSVWINEFNHNSGTTPEGDREYVEIVGPAGANVGNWKIRLINDSLVEYDRVTVNPGFIFSDIQTGWGFFVWGDPEVANYGTVDQYFATPSSQNIATTGGISLERSMGAWEHRISYGASGSAMEAFDFSFIGVAKPLYQQAPIHLSGGPLEGGSSSADFFWTVPSSGNYTPGGANTDQRLFDIQYDGVPELTSISIEQFIWAGASLQIVATGTNQWAPTVWFRTNLTLGGWEPVSGMSSDYQDGKYTLTFPKPPSDVPIVFYRVSADPE